MSNDNFGWHNVRSSYKPSTAGFGTQSSAQEFEAPVHCNPSFDYMSKNYNSNSYQRPSNNSQISDRNRLSQMPVNPNVHNYSNSIAFSQLSQKTNLQHDPQHRFSQLSQKTNLQHDPQSKSQRFGGNHYNHSHSSDCCLPHQANDRDKVSENLSTAFSDRGHHSKAGISGSSNLSKIILYLGNNPKSKIPMLKKSLAESPHGQLETVTERLGNLVKVKLSCGGQCLAEETAKSSKEATIIASCKLFESLQATNYTIVENSTYFTNSRVPNCALQVDNSLKHIYRVVYLESHSTFPFSVTGAVEYVRTEDDLSKFIDDHCKKHKKIDLFILNIDKSYRRKVSELCKVHNMTYEPINGCSDRGAVARARLDLPSLFQELKECGGQNLKYRLIPPGHDIGNEFSASLVKKEGGEIEIAKSEWYESDGRISECKQEIVEDGEGIVISKWIADNLIIMDYFKNDSTKETAKEILFRSVNDCKSFNEFIIEKTRDKLSGRITGSALIDRKLVGRATAFTEDSVKTLAAINALDNLKKYCYFIEGKPSYFGSGGSCPDFLYWRAPRESSAIYKIIDPLEVSTEDDLHQTISRFKSSPLQDLFLLENIASKHRNLAASIGMELNLQVRFFEGGMCIYKKQRPRDVLKYLLSLESGQNEKYKLHNPVCCSYSQESRQISQGGGGNLASSIPNLFDFKTEFSHKPVNFKRVREEISYNINDGGSDSSTSMKNLFDFKTEFSHEPVNFKRAREDRS